MKFNKQIVILVCLYGSNVFGMQRALQLAENNLKSAHYRIAAEKFKEVAESDDAVARAQAQLRLGQMYSTGKGASVPKSSDLALNYLREAANQQVNGPAKNKAVELLNQLGAQTSSPREDTGSHENIRPAPILLPQDLLQRYQVQPEEIGDMPFFEPFEEEEKQNIENRNLLSSPSYTSSSDIISIPISQSSPNQSEFNAGLQEADNYLSGVVSLPESLEFNPTLRAAETYLDAGQYEPAAQKFKEAADSQDAFAAAEAEYRLAELYSNGQGVGKNQKEALRLWRKVAAQKINEVAQAWALAQLGDAYLHGTGVKQSKKEAEKYFKRAQNLLPEDEELQVLIRESRQEHTPSIENIDAQLLQHLEELRTSPAASSVAPSAASQEIEQTESSEQQTPSPVIALAHFTNQPPAQAQIAPQTSRLRGYYERKLVSGSPAEKVQAQFVLGQMLIKGLLGPKDVERGKQLLREAAQQEVVNSSAASAAKNALNESVRAESEIKEQQNVQQERSVNEPSATTGVAYNFFERGISRLHDKDFENAQQDFEVALKMTNDPILRANILLNLAPLYSLKHNFIKARDYWKQVLEENADPATTAMAGYYLGMLYRYGSDEIASDFLEAAQYFSAVANQKNNLKIRAAAIFDLADMFYHSSAFYNNFDTVLQHLQKAATQTDNRDVALKAQALLKEVIDYAAQQNENLAVQQKAQKLIGVKRKAPEMSLPQQKRAKTPQEELNEALGAATALRQLSETATPMAVEHYPSLGGAINLMSAGRTKEAIEELNNVIERGDEDEKVQAYALLQNMHRR